MQAKSSLAELIRNYYHAYETKDRAAIEGLLSSDFAFTSPLDDHIDRRAYFKRCWPNCERIKAFRIERLFEEGDEAFVQYELEPIDGAPFRNVEYFVRQGNRIREVVVYFGSTVGTVGNQA
jgi:ketosteroid isomerase-like protein